MPPPRPVDPTNVAGKRIAAWFVDAVLFVILFGILTGALGLAPETTHVSTDRIRAATTLAPGATPSSDDVVNFCNDWNQQHGGWSAGICLPNMSGFEAEDGAATIVHGFGGMAWLFLGLVAVFIVYQGLLGASVGKLALGLRIVRADGSQAGVGASAIRTVLWVVDAVTCALPVLGGILILTTKGHRRIGDMAAGTYVVPATQVGHPVILPGQYHPGVHHPPGSPPFGTPPAPGGHLPPGPHGGPTATGAGPAVGGIPWAPTAPGSQPPGGPEPPEAAGSSSAEPDYEADQPIWDEARQAYIQYDSASAAWLEFDERRQRWGPIST